jgi:O-antigen/teichoic acid export membrane protein
MVAVVVALVSVPLVIGAIGTDGFGLWATVAATGALLAFADLGLGNGLINLTSSAHGHNEHDVAHRAVSSAWLLLWIVAAALVLGFALIYPLISWGDVFNVDGTLAADAGPAMAVFVVVFALGLPLAVAQKVQLGYQEGFAGMGWIAAGNVLGLIGLVVAVAAGADLPVLVLAYAGGPVVAAGLNSMLLFGRRRPWLRPSLRLADRPTAYRLMRIGALFFLLQVAVAIAYQSDVIVAAIYIGPAAAAQYSVGSRLFLLAPALVSMLLVPLWPAYSEAFARGDHAWIKRTLWRSTAGAFVVTTLVSVGLVVFAAPMVSVWLGDAVYLPPELLVGFALWAIVYATFNAIAMLLNAMGDIAFQASVGVVMAIVSIALSIELGSRFGVAGVIWGTLVAYLVVAAAPILWHMPRVLRRLDTDPFGGGRARTGRR